MTYMCKAQVIRSLLFGKKENKCFYYWYFLVMNSYIVRIVKLKCDVFYVKAAKLLAFLVFFFFTFSFH